MYRLAYIVVLIALPVAAATVDVRVTNKSGAPIESAVVYAVPAAPVPLTERRVAVMDQVNRAFVPHVLPVQTGTWVEFPNSDQIMHQVFSASPARKFSTPLYVGKGARPIQFPTTGVVAVGCTIHEEMTGYIVVVDTHHFATTAKSGRATMSNVPPGDYLLRVWFPGMRTEPKTQALTLGPNDAANATIVAP
jgi:plastocyanin